MTEQSIPPGGWRTQTFHGPTGDGGAEEQEVSGSPPVFERGACLGRYLILSLLGRGGMGEVYVAYDPELDRKVALKMLRGGPAGRDAQARLIREAQAAARLTHPNVVRVYDVGSVGDRVFVAMELVDGADLAAGSRAEARTWKEVLRIFREAGRGLAAAHDAGLVHRDFKPGNVLVAGDGRVVVVDFGLARDVGPPDEVTPDEALEPPEAETVFRLAGTPAYMAPEQIRGTPVDARADQFGFCVALWETLYGAPPFVGATPAELLRAIEAGTLREPPPGTRVPAWLRRAILRGLAGERAERYASMDELLETLDRDPAVRRRRWLQAAAVLGLAGTLATGWSRWQVRDELLCRGAERKLAGIWDDARKNEIRVALAATGTSPQGSVWRRVAPLLDSYSRDWVQQHTEACEATHLRGEQSESLLDLRMACLETRRQELRAATGLLARPDPQVARNALSIARGLSGFGGCADTRGLLTMQSPPAEPAARRRLEQTRAWIAESRVLELAGRYPEAFALSERANREADRNGYRPVQAEARLSLAATSGRMGRTATMKERLLEALDLAQASRHDEAMARALTYLILGSFAAGDPAEAHLWERLSGSAIERLGGNAEIEADRHFFLGLLAHQEHRPRQAIDHFRRFLALKHDGRTGPPASLYSAYLNLGIAYGDLGRFAEARRYFERSLQEGIDVYGPDHPGVGASLHALAEMYILQGDAAAAEANFRRSLAILERLPGPESSQALNGLARALLGQGRAAEAVPLLERATRIQAGQPRDPLDLARSRFHLARALWIRGQGGDRSRARLLAREAAELFGRLGDRARLEREEVEAWLAARERGR